MTDGVRTPVVREFVIRAFAEPPPQVDGCEGFEIMIAWDAYGWRLWLDGLGHASSIIRSFICPDPGLGWGPQTASVHPPTGELFVLMPFLELDNPNRVLVARERWIHIVHRR